MVLSLLSLIVLTLSGLGLCRLTARRAHFQSSLPIEIGVGFFIMATGVGILLDRAWLSVSEISHIIFILSLLAAVATVLSFWTEKSRGGSLPNPFQIFSQSAINKGLVLLVAGYLLLIIFNNVNRDVFPWDAFTTWMYRAKAWVTTDTAIDFISLKEWLAASPGYTLPGAHYPTATSAIAAFSSAVSGGWSGQAASLPWFFVALASAMIMGGLCLSQAPDNPSMALAAAAALVTTPLVHLHGILAGYADLWIMGTSGMGLAGICLWTQQKSVGTLALSFVLLALGCFWKTEGWLWLILGGAVVLPYYLWQQYQLRGLILLLLLAGLIATLQPLDLGPLGRWGLEGQRLSAGFLGAFAARPYNPAADYFDMTLLQGNFLLIFPLYAVALVALAIKSFRGHAGYLGMALCLVGIHGVIFGWSEYSRYAEIGTAINRFLLQSLPVLILTITAAWQVGVGQGRRDRMAHIKERWPHRVMTGVMVTLIIIVSLPISLSLFSTKTNQVADAAAQEIEPAELLPILGDLKKTVLGYQFTADNVPVGVAAFPLAQTGVAQPRYVAAESRMSEPDALSLYWINSNDPRVHSTPLKREGHALLDMSAYPDFWQQPIKEMGFLTEPRHFGATVIGSVVLSDSLFDTLPALFQHWLSPASLSHRLINNTTGHLEAPVTLNGWLVTALLLLCVLSLIGCIVFPALTATVMNGAVIGVCLLWLVGSAAHINQASALSKPALQNTAASATRARLEGGALLALAGSIKQDSRLSNSAILTVGLDQTSQFEAYRFPYTLLPVRAAAVSEKRLFRDIKGFSGTVLLFGTDAANLRETADALAELSTVNILESGMGYLMLSAEAG